MPQMNSVARTAHDLGLAAWFGGSLMGAVGLNGASSVLDDSQERTKVANAGWARWTPANLAAIGSYLVGAVVLTRANKGRLASQKGVAGVSIAKTALTALTMGATLYSRVLGQKMMDTTAPAASATNPNNNTPDDVARSQRQLRVLQWVIPAHVGALIALSSRMGEQQRPAAVAGGILRGLRRR